MTTTKAGTANALRRVRRWPKEDQAKLVQIIELGRRPNHLVIGEVVWFHYDDGLVNDRYHVDVGRVNPIGRLAGRGGYTRITDRFEMPRLSFSGDVPE